MTPETIQYMAYFNVPAPQIIEVTNVDYKEDSKSIRFFAKAKKTEFSTSQYYISKDNPLTQVFKTAEEAQAHIDTHAPAWLIENKVEIRKHNIEEAIHKIKLKDGIYNPRNTPFVVWRKSIHELLRSDLAFEIERLIEKYPDGCIAHAYETSTTFFFTETIKPYHVEQLGDGFNYGSTNLLLDCPKTLLILAEND